MFAPSSTSAVSDAAESKAMNNVMVYASAARYHLPEPNLLAKHKFEDSTTHMSTDKEFADVTKAVFSTPPSNDMGLREGMIYLYTTHFEVLMKRPEIATAATNISELSIAAKTQRVQRQIEDKKNLERALASEAVLQEDLSDTKKELVRTSKELSES